MLKINLNKNPFKIVFNTNYYIIIIVLYCTNHLYLHLIVFSLDYVSMGFQRNVYASIKDAIFFGN